MMDKKYAVFIDGDNISALYFDSIMTEIIKDGEILIKRIYGDWTTSDMNSWKQKLFNTPIRIFQQFRFGANATDNSIIMDAIELINQNKDINAFCIVSKDSDYYSLALRLRENGKYVLGIGSEESKMIWQNACNKFVKIENLIKIDILVHNVNNKYKGITDVREIINFGLDNSQMDDGGWISFSNFGVTIRSQYPMFDPRSYNHKSLLQLLRSFSEDIEIKNSDDTPPNYWLKKIQKNKDEKETGIIQRTIANFGFIENEKGTYYFNDINLPSGIKIENISVGTKVKFTVFKYPDLTKENNIEKNGKAADIEIM
jgi:uncharacterized LabA/DUF88 family protein